jgi:penicillin-binding protein 1C
MTDGDEKQDSLEDKITLGESRQVGGSFSAESDADDPTITLSGADDNTATLPPPIFTTTGNDDTPTAKPAPKQSKTPPLPLLPGQFESKQRQPVRDDQATVVNPAVSIPGHTQLSPVRDYRRPVRRAQYDNSATAQPTPTAASPAPPIVATGSSRSQRDGLGCFGRFLLISTFLLLFGVIIAVAGLAVGYMTIASELPPVSELRGRASTFETARIYDADGNELYAIADPTTGNRTYKLLADIDQDLINATIATEDARFYVNPGWDPIALSRAIYNAVLDRDVYAGGGASTITQQLVRALLLGEGAANDRSIERKVREIILAAELGRDPAYSKDDVLELYLNEIFYGNRAYGIEAAAQTYFGKSASDLTLAEASLLAGLPQAPALWDPFTEPELALGRQSEVLGLMVASGYISAETSAATLAETEILIQNLTPPEVNITYPHFTLSILQQLEEANDPQAIYHGGLRIYTTIDPATQALAEETVRRARPLLAADGANNAAMVVLDPQTGAIRAMVGSTDFNDEAISGQINMAQQPRQPGSTIKPFVYMSAMEQGWTPSTLIWDVPTNFPNAPGNDYTPKNYDDRFHGPLVLRNALGNSYNIPAVKALDYVGVCEFVSRAQQYGLGLQDDGCETVGQPRNYGPALALGGGEISPLDMASAYALLANGGRYIPPHAITRVENSRGEVLFEYEPPDPVQVIAPEYAYLLSHILSDNNARQPSFGRDNLLTIDGHRVAAKTGTSGTSGNDVRDGWTIGYTPDVATAVWVGNTDNKPVGPGKSGYGMAAPIWNSFMNQYLANRPASDFVRPPGIVELEICADSGTTPSPDCTDRRIELFRNGQLPLPATEHFIANVPIDLWTQQVANQYCNEPGSVYEANFFNIPISARPDAEARYRAEIERWIQQTGWGGDLGLRFPLQRPPTSACQPDTPRPTALINQPVANQTLGSGLVQIGGSADAPNFRGYTLEYGLSNNPQAWAPIQARRQEPQPGGLLGLWDPSTTSGGPMAIRLTVFGPDNPYTPGFDEVSAEISVPLNLVQPTVVPTSTPLPTPTPPLPPTPTVTPTISPTPTPGVVPSPTSELPTPTPTATPSPTDGPPPEDSTPTPTPTPDIIIGG